MAEENKADVPIKKAKTAVLIAAVIWRDLFTRGFSISFSLFASRFRIVSFVVPTLGKYIYFSTPILVFPYKIEVKV